MNRRYNCTNEQVWAKCDQVYYDCHHWPNAYNTGLTISEGRFCILRRIWAQRRGLKPMNSAQARLYSEGRPPVESPKIRVRRSRAKGADKSVDLSEELREWRDQHVVEKTKEVQEELAKLKQAYRGTARRQP